MKVTPIPFSQSFSVTEKIGKISESKALVEKVKAPKLIKPLMTDVPTATKVKQLPISKIIGTTLVFAAGAFVFYMVLKTIKQNNEKKEKMI
ncbi:MAG: hypothetical protein ACPG21_13890 [Crocinitomicaceae bacterium]